jgi:hypothetical protein
VLTAVLLRVRVLWDVTQCRCVSPDVSKQRTRRDRSQLQNEHTALSSKRPETLAQQLGVTFQKTRILSLVNVNEWCRVLSPVGYFSVFFVHVSSGDTLFLVGSKVDVRLVVTGLREACTTSIHQMRCRYSCGSTRYSWVLSNAVLVSVLSAVGELVGRYCCGSVPWLTWFVSGLSPRRPGSVPDQSM